MRCAFSKFRLHSMSLVAVETGRDPNEKEVIMSKHTPGDWTLEQHGNETQVVSSSLTEIDERGGCRSVHIATIRGGLAVNGPHGNSGSNGHLIKAAPQMLKVLTAICEFWQEAEENDCHTTLSPDALIGGHDNDCEPITIQDLVKAAVLKATGR